MSIQTQWPLSIRTQQFSDEPAILDLLKITVGETEASRKTEAFWRWKHQLNPFGESQCVCAVDDETGVLAGLRPMMWWDFRDPTGTRIRTARPVDTATHPSFQRRGIFSTLTKYSVEELRSKGVGLIFNTPNPNSLPGYLKMGWGVVARWPIFARICSPTRALRHLAQGARPIEGEENPATTDHPTWQEFASDHPEEIERILADNEKLRRRVGYRVIRTPIYLDWRYGRHPDIRYHVVPSYDHSRLNGFLIGRRTHSKAGLGAFVITEMFLLQPRIEGFVRLLRTAFRQLPELYVLAHFSKGTVERSSLRRTGFIRLPKRGYTFVARSLNSLPLDPLLPRSWDLTLGELEIF